MQKEVNEEKQSRVAIYKPNRETETTFHSSLCKNQALKSHLNIRLLPSELSKDCFWLVVLLCFAPDTVAQAILEQNV